MTNNTRRTKGSRQRQEMAAVIMAMMMAMGRHAPVTAFNPTKMAQGSRARFSAVAGFAARTTTISAITHNPSASYLGMSSSSSSSTSSKTTATTTTTEVTSSSLPTTNNDTSTTLEEEEEEGIIIETSTSDFYFPTPTKSSTTSTTTTTPTTATDTDAAAVCSTTTAIVDNTIDVVVLEEEEQASEVSSLWSKLQETVGGQVDDINERIIHPELLTGEVPRLFSTLEYTKNTMKKDGDDDTDKTTVVVVSAAIHKPTSTTLGAALLVAGTTVGAGVLALPSATVSSGFIPSSIALTGAWIYMTISGLLIAELVLNKMIQTGKPGSGLLNLYQDILGGGNSDESSSGSNAIANGNLLQRVLPNVASSAYFFLHYVVMIAYIAQGGVNVNGFIESTGIISVPIAGNIDGQFLFAGICATILYFTSTQIIETLNNLLVVAVIVSFFSIVGVASTSCNFEALVAGVNQHPENVFDALPILFLSMVYHNIVPTIVNQLEGDRTKITIAIISGTAIPFIMFLTWNGVMLGNLLNTGLSPDIISTIDPVQYLQTHAASGENGALLSTLVTSFSQLAIITSLIGFVYGLLDALTDAFDLPLDGPAFEKYKPILFATIFIPPTILSLNPNVFYNALEYGGAFGVSTLFLLLPAIMVYNVRYGPASNGSNSSGDNSSGNQATTIAAGDGDDENVSDDQQQPISIVMQKQKQPLGTPPMVPFGKIPLGSMSIIAATLILEQGVEKIITGGSLLS